MRPGPEGERARRAEYLLCKHDIVHWLTYWGWLFNPWKEPEKQEFPYIPYEFQEQLITYLRDAIVRCNRADTVERENVVIDKCREMAGSWSVYAVILHDFLFFNGSYVILSWKREEVDQPGNMDTPFAKLRFMLQRLPEWMLPKGWDWRTCSNVGILKNPAGASIGSEAMTQAAGAGGRVRAAIFDEFGKIKDGTDFAAWRSMSGTTRLRIAISTPEGRDNKFGRLATGEEKEARTLISLHWWKDPIKMQGWKWVNGKLTSPWYEEQKRTLDPVTLASQVDISYDNSIGGVVFGDVYSLWHQVKDHSLTPVVGMPIIVTLDPGVHMFASFTQFDHYDRYLMLDEQYDEKTDIDIFVENIQRKQRDRFKDHEFIYLGDPAGGAINSAMHKLKSEYLYLLETYKWVVEYNFQGPNRADWVQTRIRVLKQLLKRNCPQLSRETGPAPMVLIDVNRCEKIHTALSSGYRYKVESGTNRVLDRIEDGHPHEDAADCVTYPPIWKGMNMDRREDRKKRDRSGSLEWRDTGVPYA